MVQYSNADDAGLVTQLGPENLNHTISSGEPSFVTCGQEDSSQFDDVTSTLSGIVYLLIWVIHIL